MSRRSQRAVRRSVARREVAEAAGARRRRRAWIAVGVAILIVAGVVASTIAHQSARAPAATAASAQQLAPDGTFTSVSGTTMSVASLRGKPTLLWFVTTWCSSCQAGTQLLAANLPRLAADGVRVVELELFEDLGQSGPSIGSFARTFARAEATNPDWTWGVSSAGLTRTYDPQSELEVYYLLNANGQITYVNSPLVATMPQLLAHAAKLA